MERPPTDFNDKPAAYQSYSLTSVPQFSAPTSTVKLETSPMHSEYSPMTNRRNGLVKYCGVCGDIAKSYHFGGLSCDSCKAFFRRSVQNDNYLHFLCSQNQGQCVINMSNRKSCQYCRMNRCFGIGMEKSWVMTEEERKALMKARADKKLRKQLAASASNTTTKTVYDFTSELGFSLYEPHIEQMTDFLAPVEIKEIESIVTKYMHAYQHVPYRSELRLFDSDRPGSQAVEMFGTLIRRFAFYSRLMADFSSLPFSDQSNLLKGGVMEMCVLRGALVFDPVNNHWPNTNMSMYKDAPSLKLGNITHLTSNRIFQMHMDFINCIQQMGVDEPTIMMLVLIVLFTPERSGLVRIKWIEKYQAYYISLLERYMGWRFGLPRSKSMFCKLLTKLSDLREFSDSHNRQNIQLESDEIATIQNQLSQLKINPYPECKGIIFEDAEKPVDIHPGNSSAQCVYPVPPSVPIQRSTEPSASTTRYLPQQPVAPSHQPNHEQHHYYHTEEMNPNIHRDSSFCDGGSDSNNGPMAQQGNINREPTQTANMATQFMQAMQQSISQVVDIPFFGYEQVKPDYQFDPIVDDDDVFENLNPTVSQATTSAQFTTVDSRYNCDKSENPQGAELPQSPTLTPQTMEVLYEALEEYSESYDFKNSS